MQRRSLGSGRRLAVVAALVIAVGSVLPWYVAGGDGALPPIAYRAFDGSGLLAFLAALLALALVALPYAAGGRPVPLDRGLAYWVLAAAALAGVLLWVPAVLEAPEGLLPDRATGYWVAVAGTLLLVRAAYEVSIERRED